MANCGTPDVRACDSPEEHPIAAMTPDARERAARCGSADSQHPLDAAHGGQGCAYASRPPAALPAALRFEGADANGVFCDAAGRTAARTSAGRVAETNPEHWHPSSPTCTDPASPQRRVSNVAGGVHTRAEEAWEEAGCVVQARIGAALHARLLQRGPRLSPHVLAVVLLQLAAGGGEQGACGAVGVGVADTAGISARVLEREASSASGECAAANASGRAVQKKKACRADAAAAGECIARAEGSASHDTISAFWDEATLCSGAAALSLEDGRPGGSRSLPVFGVCGTSANGRRTPHGAGVVCTRPEQIVRLQPLHATHVAALHA